MEKDNRKRWMRFSRLGQIKYGEAALRGISEDIEVPKIIRQEADDLLRRIQVLMNQYKETLK